MTKLLWLPVLSLAVLGLAPLLARAQTPSNSSALSAGERLHKLFADDWDYYMTEFPENATEVGYPGQNGRWTDYSPEATARHRAHARQTLATLEAIDRSKLSPADQLNYDLYLEDVRQGVESERFHLEFELIGYDNLAMPLNQLGGVHIDVARMLNTQPAATTADYEAILSRLRGVPKLIDQTMALLEAGRKQGLTPPKITLRSVPDEAKTLLVEDPAKNPLLEAFQHFPDDVPAAERGRLASAADAALNQQVLPAYRKLLDYLTNTYIPAARETIALTALPDGRDWYAFLVRHYTTTDLTPEQIHQIGLDEVKRIRGEMEKVIASTGFKGSFSDFTHFLRTDPRFYYTDKDQLVADFRNLAKRADPELVHLFGKLPRLTYGVKPMPAYQEESAPSAYYEPGSPAAARPGWFLVNTYNLAARPKWGMESLMLHESVPGHHLQIALAQELEGVPEFRRWADYTAFVEGWALYSEGLGYEMGFYTDPYSEFGQLTDEMWRAVRLVVDTGMHSMGWTRQQAIDFFRDNTAATEHDIEVEIDRYIVWPGQALAYKMGQLKIKELRRRAQSALGERFSLRAFHDQVLAAGALPLDVLDARIQHWIDTQKARAAPTR